MNRLISAFLFLLISTAAFSQNRTITGRVTDQHNNPLPGATIILSPDGKQTTSDQSGAFKITATATTQLIGVNFVGYKLFKEKLTAVNYYTISLQPDEAVLDEVVLVGTRSTGRTRLNTAVPVDVFNIPKLQLMAPQNDLNQLLQYASPSFNQWCSQV